MKKATYPLLIFLLSISLAFSQTKVQLEFQSYYGLPSLSDLKTAVDYRESLLNYSYTFKENSELTNLHQNMSSDFKNIEYIIPSGERLRISFNSFLSISLGVDFSSREVKSSFIQDSTFKLYGLNTISKDSENYIQNIRMIMPSFIIYFSSPKFFNGSFEVYTGVGPILGKTEILAKGSTDFSVEKLGSTKADYRSKIDGEGIGIGILGGLRLNVFFSKKAGIFIGSHYLYGRINKISGSGYFIQASTSDGKIDVGDFSSSWEEEEWYVGLDERDTPGKGKFSHEFVSNNPKFVDKKIRNFILDFSGIYAGIGIFAIF